MGGLAHYLEAEEIPTTQISLIREHTEIIKPPRALWVPFELGRPFGAPDAPEFQADVLRAALALLEETEGPVLADFPDEAPDAGLIEGWACPVSFAPPDRDENDLKAALGAEIAQLRPWHDLWLEARGRSSVGASGVEIEAAAEFIAAHLDEAAPARPRPELDAGALVKLVLEDLKAFYLEAALAQPGQTSSRAAADWFLGETTLGPIIGLISQKTSPLLPRSIVPNPSISMLVRIKLGFD